MELTVVNYNNMNDFFKGLDKEKEIKEMKIMKKRVKAKVKELKKEMKERGWKWRFGYKKIVQCLGDEYSSFLKIKTDHFLDAIDPSDIEVQKKLAFIYYYDDLIAIIPRVEIDEKYKEVLISNRTLRSQAFKIVAEYEIKIKDGLLFSNEDKYLYNGRGGNDKIYFLTTELKKIKNEIKEDGAEDDINSSDIQKAIDTLKNYLAEQEYFSSIADRKLVICEQALIADARIDAEPYYSIAKLIRNSTDAYKIKNLKKNFVLAKESYFS